MSKQPTRLHLDTVDRELRRAINAVVEAWRETNPCPSWEEEREWEQANPSPRRIHHKAADELHDQLEKDANDLMVRITLGEVQTDAIYDELKRKLATFDEKRLSYLKLTKS